MRLNFIKCLMAGLVLTFAGLSALHAQNVPARTEFSYPTELDGGFHVFGMESGYLIFAEPVEMNGRTYSDIMFEAPLPECEQYEGRVIVRDGYQVTHLAVDERRFVFRAEGDGMPEFEFVLVLDADGGQAWLDGAEHVEHLGYARFSQGGQTVITQVAFWIGG